MMIGRVSDNATTQPLRSDCASKPVSPPKHLHSLDRAIPWYSHQMAMAVCPVEALFGILHIEGSGPKKLVLSLQEMKWHMRRISRKANEEMR